MSPQPIPKYIERLALKLANTEAEKAQQANTREGAREIARRLEAESEAGGFPSVKEYIAALTKDPQGVAPAEGTQPTSAFWSHGTPHAEAPPNWLGENFLDNRYVAEAWAVSQNKRSPGSARTLETTDGGRRLNAMYLFQDSVRNALGGDEQGYTYEWARDCWGDISQTYAEAAQGPVVVFAETAHTRSILYKSELPTLHTNQRVGVEEIHFAYSAPQGWSQEARDELGADAVRAQVQVDDPTLPHYIDPATYATQDPVARKAALEAECASVADEREQRAAERATNTSTEATEPKAPEAEAPARETPEQTAKPPASLPVWQLGFRPTPVKAEAAPTASAAESKAPPSPDLGRQTTGTGLG
ncbi:hypothetical protein [Streptomyces sp. NPDC088254]|uniref:hypothetical protein n=1 Tax=Streptomyces sp. NPDC088254 TaxID=3365847 RepID=UPI0037F8818D